MSVDELMARGRIDEAFGVLAAQPDMRAADLPALSTGTLKALTPEAVEKLVLGAVSPSASVRRFARKYVPKAGTHAVAPLVRLAVTSLEPMRPGSDSPLGEHIRREKLGFDPPAPPAVYSPAQKLAREAVENVWFLLTTVSATHAFRFFELCEGAYSGFRYGGAEAIDRPWPGADVFQAKWITWDGVEQMCRSKHLHEAVRTWTEGRALLDDGGDAALAGPWQALPEVNREAARRYLRLRAIQMLHYVDKPRRIELLALAQRQTGSLPEPDGQFYQKYLDEFIKSHPDEVPVTQVEHLHGRGPKDVEYLNALADLAECAGRLDVREQLIRMQPEEEREWYDPETDAPNPVTDLGPGCDRVLQEAAAIERAADPNPPEKPWMPKCGMVPEEALRKAPWQPAMADLVGALVRAIRFDPPAGWKADFASMDETTRAGLRLGRVLANAVVVLDEDALDRLACGLPHGVRIGWDYERMMLESMHRRALCPRRLLAALMRPDEGFAGDRATQAAVARLYAREDAESHALARGMVGEVPLPQGGQHDRRDHVYPSWQWLIWTAWRRRDAELLASAMERCAMSYHAAKGKPQVPEAPPRFEIDGCAPSTIQEPGVALDEVWRLVREQAPARVPGIVRRAFQLADVEDFPRRLLSVIAASDPGALDGCGEQAAALLESSEAAAACAAAEVLAARPELAEPVLDAVLAGLQRGLSSTTAGLVKACASAVSAVGRAHPRRAGDAQQGLCALLERDAPVLVEQGLRRLAELRSGSGVPPLGAETRVRLEHLAAADPKRFEKLARRLLS